MPAVCLSIFISGNFPCLFNFDDTKQAGIWLRGLMLLLQPEPSITHNTCGNGSNWVLPAFFP
jgi:hypothetical protein